MVYYDIALQFISEEMSIYLFLLMEPERISSLLQCVVYDLSLDSPRHITEKPSTFLTQDSFVALPSVTLVSLQQKTKFAHHRKNIMAKTSCDTDTLIPLQLCPLSDGVSVSIRLCNLSKKANLFGRKM